jgi:hypothetical protein
MLAAIAAMTCFDPPRAEAEPAVSGINGKLTTFGGVTSTGDGEQEGLGGLAGSLTVPLGSAFGAQLDGAWARIGDEDFASTGLHVFWRDPRVGLVGLYGGFAHLTDAGGQDIGRIGAEAQYFAGNITLDAAAGIRFGDLDEDAYGRAKIDFYPIEDLKLSGGFAYDERGFGLASAEFQFASSQGVGVSLFAEGRINDEDNYTALGGIKVYLGEAMSLINRHRKQDPDGYTDLDMTATQEAAAAASNQSTPGGGSICPFTPYPKADACTVLENCFADQPPRGSLLTEAQYSACRCAEASQECPG